MSEKRQFDQLDCNETIDYSTVDTRFSFFIQLEPESVLFPGPGENQKFCYSIIGIGQDTQDFVDISHFVFVICPDITYSQLENVQVSIDGAPQDVNVGPDGNVEILTDPPTGCTGLKFDFPVDKVLNGEGSRLFLCYELNTVYPVGDTEVCLKGSVDSVSGLSICGPVCKDISCIAMGFQRSNICVPVTVKPFADAGTTTTKCCNLPIISDTCSGVLNGSCQFTMTQQICVEVPVEFGATTQVGATSVECVSASNSDCQGCS